MKIVPRLTHEAWGAYECAGVVAPEAAAHYRKIPSMSRGGVERLLCTSPHVGYLVHKTVIYEHGH